MYECLSCSSLLHLSAPMFKKIQTTRNVLPLCSKSLLNHWDVLVKLLPYLTVEESLALAVHLQKSVIPPLCIVCLSTHRRSHGAGANGMEWTCRDGIATKLLYIRDATSPASRTKLRSSDMAFDNGMWYAEPSARYPAIFRCPSHPLL